MAKHFTYYGVNVYPLRPNSTGLRYEAAMESRGAVKADTKDGVKYLIRANLPASMLRKSRS